MLAHNSSKRGRGGGEGKKGLKAVWAARERLMKGKKMRVEERGEPLNKQRKERDSIARKTTNHRRTKKEGKGTLPLSKRHTFNHDGNRTQGGEKQLSNRGPQPPQISAGDVVKQLPCRNRQKEKKKERKSLFQSFENKLLTTSLESRSEQFRRRKAHYEKKKESTL